MVSCTERTSPVLNGDLRRGISISGAEYGIPAQFDQWAVRNIDFWRSQIDLWHSHADFRRSQIDLWHSSIDLWHSLVDLWRSHADLRRSHADLRRSAVDLWHSSMDLGPGLFRGGLDNFQCLA